MFLGRDPRRPKIQAPGSAQPLTVAVLGLGEAGRLFATGLVRSGAVVRGYDPRVTAGDGVIDNPDAASACQGADLVLSINSAAHALDVLAQGLPGCAPGTIWADLNTAAPAVKQAVRDAAGPTLRVVDVAIMAPVPARGLGTPMTVSGPAAEEFAAAMRRHGATVDVVDGPVGAAATRKLIRSVFLKGVAAAAVEALTAAEEAGLAEWLSHNIVAELVGFDAATLDRFVTGSRVHAERRVHEMEAAAQLLDALGVPARVSRASRDWLVQLASASRELSSPVAGPDWEEKVAAVWASAAGRSDDEVVEAISVVAAERSPDDAAALFERASAFDYAGREAEAEPLYRAALAAGLDEPRRAQAVIQLASTVRNLGRAAESVELLRAEIAAGPADGLADARAAFLALALVDAGRATEAVVEALTALAPHLTRYGRAVTDYADELRARGNDSGEHRLQVGPGA